MKDIHMKLRSMGFAAAFAALVLASTAAWAGTIYLRAAA
jgi:hypothetical protein